MPSLSVIVPVYNSEKYLIRCVNSILDQTFRDFELILVNDGSTDSSPAICDSFKQKDSRVVVIHQHNQGHSMARKSGLNISKGDYIAFVDSDDWIDSEMYQEMYSAIEKYHSDIVICGIKMIKDEKISYWHQNLKPGFYSKKDLEEHIYPLMIFNHHFYTPGLLPSMVNKIYKRELILSAIERIDKTIRIAEDVCFFYPCALTADSMFLMTNNFYYNYLYNTSSITKKYIAHFSDDITSVCRFLKNELSNYNPKYKLMYQLDYFISYLVFSLINNEFKKGVSLTFKQKKQNICDTIQNENVQNSLKKVSLNHLIFNDRIYILLLRFKLVGVLYLLITINRLVFKLKNYKQDACSTSKSYKQDTCSTHNINK